MRDEEIIERFEKWQVETGKYTGLDLSKVEYEETTIDGIQEVLQKGKTPKYSEEPTKVTVIKSGQARGGNNNFDFQKRQYLREDKIDLKDHRNLHKKDLLINTTGKGTAGRVTLFNLDGDFVVDSHVAILRLNKAKYLPDYILNYFLSIGFSNLESMATGQGGQVELGIGTLKSLKLGIPKDYNAEFDSLTIQKAIAEYLGYVTEYDEGETARMKRVSGLWDEMRSAIVNSFFDRDSDFATRLEERLKSKGLDFDLNDLEFEYREMNQENIASFPTFTSSKTSEAIKIEAYEELSKENQKEYIPIASATKYNNQISGYVHKSKLKASHITPKGVVSWTRINPSQFYFQDEPICTTDDSYVFVASPKSYAKYLQRVTENEMADLGYDWTKKAGPTILKKLEVPIPKDTKSYSSREIQVFISDFFESYYNHIVKQQYHLDRLVGFYQEHLDATIVKTFEGMKNQAND